MEGETYDVIVCGTGLTECILSGLLSVDGLKVLHIDRNDYYGAECASLNLEQLYKHFNEGAVPAAMGRPRDYNVDLIPKFLISQGKMVKILLHTDVTRYLEFKSVDGSYVWRDKKVYKVPATEREALGSSLMGLFEKKRFKDFLEFATQWDANEPKTYKHADPNKTTAALSLKPYNLDKGTVDFVGHAMALFTDETWLEQPCKEFLQRVKLYADSLQMAVYQYEGRSPYLYPLYGLGDLPQAFARLAAIYGGTYMLQRPVDEILFENGKVVGVKSQGEVAKCRAVICDPSYAREKTKKIGQAARAICILDHPIPNTDNSESCQIIIPAPQVKRQNDIYIFCVSSAHSVAPKGKYIVIVSTNVETANPEKELEPGLQLLGPIVKKFFSVSDIYEPVNNAEAEQLFVSKSYDAQSHFESVSDDVMRIYKQFTGKDVDLSPKKQEGQ
jgi:Rab GDP dissociation inhibitor